MNTLTRESHPIPGTITSILKDVGTFIYETPAWIIASLVTGIALLILLPQYASPFLAFPGGAILTRLAVKLIDVYDNELLMQAKEKLLAFQKKFFYVQYVAFAISIFVTLVLPIGGIMAGISLGIYKGLIVELEIIKYKQQVRREELKQPIKEERVLINNS